MYLGDFKENAIVYVPLTTNAATGGAIAPSDPFEASDIKIYKNGSNIEKTTANGITMSSPFDAITGLHNINIDTSVDTGDLGFWVAEADYIVVLVPDETVDGQAVVHVLAQFSIENRFNEVNVTKINGDTTSVSNLELQFNEVGLTGDTFPATQLQLLGIVDAIYSKLGSTSIAELTDQPSADADLLTILKALQMVVFFEQDMTTDLWTIYQSNGVDIWGRAIMETTDTTRTQGKVLNP